MNTISTLPQLFSSSRLRFVGVGREHPCWTRRRGDHLAGSSAVRGSTRVRDSISSYEEAQRRKHTWSETMTNDEYRERIEFSARNPGKCPFTETDLRARLLMSQNSQLDYGQACHAVWRADTDLHRLYLNTATPVHPTGD